MLASGKGLVAIIDDDNEMRAMLEDFLKREDYRTKSFTSANEALIFLASPEALNPLVELVISDIRMPELDGITFTEKLKHIRPELPVVLVTAFGSIETAKEGIRKGAYDYLTKPFKLSEILLVIDRAIDFSRLKSDNRILRNEVTKNWSMGELIGKSPGMKAIFDLVQRVAQANANVLITGESGTGKQLIARAVHNTSARANQPFIVFNCTALPEVLVEEELFGHSVNGSLNTNAEKKGLFEEASHGTLYIDEISHLDISTQTKLLKVMQEKKYKTLGDNAIKDFNVRIIASTQKDLKESIKNGHFREDLYYRLAVIPIVVPPLRHRREDIPLLAHYFLKKASAANGSRVSGFSQAALQKLVNLRWDGNVRELESMIEGMAIIATHSTIQVQDIPTAEQTQAEHFFGQSTQDFPTVEQLEKRYIQLILEKTGGRKEKAAQILGINRRTLYRKEREYGLVDNNEADNLSDE